MVNTANIPTTAANLINKYFKLADNPAPGETAPLQRTLAMTGNHRTQAFIDGIAFFTAIEQEMDALLASAALGRFFYIAGWWLGLAGVKATLRVNGLKKSDTLPITSGEWNFNLDADAFLLPVSNTPILTKLSALATAGVNVRVLGWVSPFINVEPLGQALGDINFHTIMTVDALRRRLPSPENVLLNTLGHSMGAVHCKLIICGEQSGTDFTMRAYTSGLDIQADRLIPPGAAGGWHDIGVRVEGNAAGVIHDFYKNMWNEQLQRKVETFEINGRNIVSHDKSWKSLVSRAVASLPVNTGQQFVQVLRTVPQMNFGQATARRRGQLLLPDSNPVIQTAVGTFANLAGFKRPPISFAPRGIFEFKVALQIAISQAEKYIFIADQALQSQEIMDWIQQRLGQKPNLKVILFYGADPNDPPSGLMAEAINRHLLAGVMRDMTGQPRNIVARQWDNNTVHAKVTMIDDAWCAIGSANCMRRSLYTDVELSVGIAEVPIPAAQLPKTAAEVANPGATGKVAPTFVQRFRRDLWAHYCQISPAGVGDIARKYRLMLDLDRCLRIWHPTWGVPFPGVALRGEISPLNLGPFPTDANYPYQQIDADIYDADARDRF